MREQHGFHQGVVVMQHDPGRDQHQPPSTEAVQGTGRQPGTMTRAMWGADGPFSANDDMVEYPPFFADAAATLTHWFLAAADDERVVVEALERPVMPVRGERLYFAPGTLVVTWPEDQA